MYPQDIAYMREKSRYVPAVPLRIDPQFSLPPKNFAAPSIFTPRSPMNDYQGYNQGPYLNTDRPMASSMILPNDYLPDSVKLRPAAGIGMSPYSGNTPRNVSMINSGIPNRMGPNPIGYPIVGMSPKSNSGLIHPNFVPMTVKYNSHATPFEKQHSSVERSSDLREDQVLKYLERQNAVIEKLAIRIQQEERESVNREKKELEQKLRELETEKLLRQQQIMNKANTDEVELNKSRSKHEKPKEKEKTNTLEQLGKFYLMSQLFDKNQRKSANDINELLLSPLLSKKAKASLIDVDEVDEPSPEVLPKSLKRLGTQKNSRVASLALDDHDLRHPSPSLPDSPPRRDMLPPIDSHRGRGELYDISPLKKGQSRVFDNARDSADPERWDDFDLKRMKTVATRNFDYTPRRRNDRGPPMDDSYSDDYYDGDPRDLRPQRTMKKTKTGVYGNSPNNKKLNRAGTRVRLDSARAQNAASEIRKQQEKRKTEMRSKLRVLLWCMNYPHLLFNDVIKKVESRKAEINAKMSKNLQSNFEIAESFLIAICEKSLKELVLETKPLELISPKKPFSDSELNSRTNQIFLMLKVFFDKLIVGTSTTNLPKNFLRFLASISEDSSVPPSNFMFDFEVKRLQFTYYATLKFMTPLKSKMVIGLFILLRVLLHKIIMRPWTSIPGVKKDKVKMGNLLTIGSILYHTVLDFFRGNTPIYPNNQNFLPPELKVKPRSVPLQAMDEIQDVDEQAYLKNKDDSKKEPEPITGFLTKEQLKCLFVDRKKLYDQLKALVDGWLEKIYQLTHTIYLNTPKEERETLGIPI